MMKKEYVIHIRNSKQVLHHGLVLKKVHRAVRFNENAWLKSYIDMNTKLRKNKNDFEKNFLKLMNNSVFRKTMENVRNHGDVNLITIEARSNYLMSEPNYHKTKNFPIIY